jgi:hypothetical protein
MPTPTVTVSVTRAATLAPSPAANNTDSSSTAIQVWTLIVAGLAVVASLISAWLVRRTGRGQVDAAKQASAASERSAEAAEKSARAAQQSVGLNRETAAGVARRAESDALAKRYQEAADQLGHEKAPVRLAGVYAMAKLADDWSSERQSCVNVLCAYLRMPWPEPDGAKADAEVRRSIATVMSDHLNASAPLSWSDITLDFSNAVLLDFSLIAPVFDQPVRVVNTRFLGRCELLDPIFKAGGAFSFARIEGRLSIDSLTLTDGQLAMDQFHVEGQANLSVDVKYVCESERSYIRRWPPDINLDNGHVTGGFSLVIRGSDQEQGTISLRRTHIETGAQVLCLADSGNSTGFWPAVFLDKWQVDRNATVKIFDHSETHEVIEWSSPQVAEELDVTIIRDVAQ